MIKITNQSNGNKTMTTKMRSKCVPPLVLLSILGLIKIAIYDLLTLVCHDLCSLHKCIAVS